MNETENFKSKNPKSRHTDANLPDLLENTPVTTHAKHPTTGEKTIFNGIFICWDKDNDAKIKVPDLSSTVYRRPKKFTVLTNTTVEELFSQASTPAVAENIKEVTTEIPEPAKKLAPAKVFDINKRFTFLGQLVKMVVNGQAVSAILSGGGGLGKTFEVMGQVKAAGLEAVSAELIDEDISAEDVELAQRNADVLKELKNDILKTDTQGDYKVIKGFSTARGLYNTLYYNRKKLIIFDDCDSVLQNDVAVNILKGALDSYEERIITWAAQAVAGSEIPNEFEFEGRVIFITNIPQEKLPQALVSRSTTIDVSMTVEEKLTRIKKTLPFFRPDVDIKIRKEAFKVVTEWAFHAKDLNFRTILKAINIFDAELKNGLPKKDIIELVEYSILS